MIQIYIPSLGRYKQNKTARALLRMGIDDFLVVVEPHEYELYAEAIDKKNLLILDLEYKKKYRRLTADNSVGSGPGAARNFIWDHSISSGAKWHWVMDDNIQEFHYYNRNRVFRAKSRDFFRIMEDFVGMYANVSMAGPQYHNFVMRRQKYKPFIKNTRIFSCNLIKNSAPFRWRGRFNEDLILSLDMLSAGYGTVLFNFALIDKEATQLSPGGNNTDAYSGGTFLKSRMMVETYPEISKIKITYGRIHHATSMKKFKENKWIKSGKKMGSYPDWDRTK